MKATNSKLSIFTKISFRLTWRGYSTRSSRTSRVGRSGVAACRGGVELHSRANGRPGLTSRGQPGYHPRHERDRDGIACRAVAAPLAPAVPPQRLRSDERRISPPLLARFGPEPPGGCITPMMPPRPAAPAFGAAGTDSQDRMDLPNSYPRKLNASLARIAHLRLSRS